MLSRGRDDQSPVGRPRCPISSHVCNRETKARVDTDSDYFEGKRNGQLDGIQRPRTSGRKIGTFGIATVEVRVRSGEGSGHFREETGKDFGLRPRQRHSKAEKHKCFALIADALMTRKPNYLSGLRSSNRGRCSSLVVRRNSDQPTLTLDHEQRTTNNEPTPEAATLSNGQPVSSMISETAMSPNVSHKLDFSNFSLQKRQRPPNR